MFALSLGSILGVVGKVESQKLKVKSGRKKLKIFLYGLISSIYLVAIVLSKSRGAIIGLFTVIFILAVNFFISRYRYIFVSGIIKRFGSILVAIFLGLFIGFSAWFFINISQFTPDVSNPWVRPSGTGTIRLCVWEGTKSLLKDHFIFGAGLSGFREMYSKKYITCDAEPLEYPHNIILNFWSETGLLGLLSFILIIVFYFQFLMQQKAGALKAAFAAAMLYWVVHGLVDVPYFKNDLSLEFWVLVGLVSKIS